MDYGTCGHEDELFGDAYHGLWRLDNEWKCVWCVLDEFGTDAIAVRDGVFVIIDTEEE